MMYLDQVSAYPNAGTILLGKYRVESLIGTGGMGYVLRAHHLELDQPVAIKCLLPEMLVREDQVQRFLREARACSRLRGANIARVMDVGRLPDSSPIMVMEYLEGADLGAIIKAYGAQDITLAVDLMLQACEGLAEAHGAGIVHRDVKSSNFFIIQHPNQPPLLKVLDFGIATAPTGKSELTAEQTVMGTPDYMSPEQMRSTKEVDQRSDIWSLGVVMYELLTGTRPFVGETYASLCFAVGMDPPLPIHRAEVGMELRQIIDKCLTKSLTERFQTVAELAWSLVAFASDPALARGVAERCSRYLGVGGSPQTWDHQGSRDSIALPSTGPQSHRSFKSLPPVNASLPSNTPTEHYASPTPQHPDAPFANGQPSNQVIASSGKNRGAMIAVCAAVAIIGGSVVAWQLSKSNSQQPERLTSSPASAAIVVDAPPSVTQAATTATVMAKLHVVSNPVGAKVWRGATMLGVTPLDLTVDATVGDGTEQIRIELAGRGQTSLSVDLELQASKRPTTPPKKKTTDDKPAGGSGEQPLDIIKNR
jgi:serine/threonine protein kinase